MATLNRLQHETSPYLLQHAENPVDWYPWGDEALKKAKAEDKPILLSIGYSACHWCHVMAHESFEDDATAVMMNDLFVNIKVDREERPDIDDIYMQATQIFLRGGGGWPMTAFLTPDGKPFHAGTYYPKEPRYGMPSFQQVMQAVHDAYQTRRDEIETSASKVVEYIQSQAVEMDDSDAYFTESLLAKAAQQLVSQADMIHGGLHGGQPKFPSPMNLEYLLRYVAHTNDKSVLHVVTFTLRKMAQGGIYDQLGYGFHRYSVDAEWLVPHFEKMLYDNAQLARLYLHAYQLTKDDFFATIAHQILTYIEREMLDPSGGFYSAQDADSEGEEGKFFVWRPQEIEEVLSAHLSPEKIQSIMNYWDVTAGGNFEGHNILNINDELDEHDLDADTLETARKLLFEHRETRIKPERDEKILAAWNGMMLAAFAEAARVFANENYLQIAERNAAFLLNELSMPDGRLYRTYKAGKSKLNGYLEDYACVVDGLLELYQTNFDATLFTHAQRLTDHVLDHFTSDDGGGFYDTSDDHETLVARPRSLQDNAVPSGNSMLAYNLMRLAAYTGNTKYETAAMPIFRQTLAAVQQYPSAFGQVLSAYDLLIRRGIEVAMVGKRDTDIFNLVQTSFLPRILLAWSEAPQDEAATPPLLAHRTLKDNQLTVYVCQNFVCKMPVTTVEATKQLLSEI